MTAPPVVDRVVQAIIDSMRRLPAMPITLASRLREDLGIKNLDLINIVLALEAEYGVELDDRDLLKVELQVRDLVGLLERRMQQ